MSRRKYEIGERIGGGGMAEVFRARLDGAEGFRRPVAIKRVLPGLSSDEAFCEMFVREAKIASLLTHPNIASVLDFDHDDDGRLFIVMELVDGHNLRDVLRRGPLERAPATQVAADILRALSYAHSLQSDGKPMQIVHRDVTPHNVIVGWDGTSKLTDFGIAKAAAQSPLTRTGVIKGKTAYLSPEQATAQTLDGRSDLFAAGIILYEMLTGSRLFSGANDAVVMHNIVMVDAPPLTDACDVSPAMNELCKRLLVRDRESRFSTANEALAALLDCPEASVRGPLDVRDEMKRRFLETPDQRPHVPDGEPLGDFTRVAPVDADSRDLELPTTPDEAPAEDTGPTLAPSSPIAKRNQTVFDRPVADATMQRNVEPFQGSMFVEPTVMPRKRWPMLLLIVTPIIAVLGWTAGRRYLEPRTESVPTQLVAPEASVTVSPRPVRIQAAPSKEANHEPTSRRPSRRPFDSALEKSGASVESPESEKFDAETMERRVRQLGNRIRLEGQRLPERMAAQIDLRYLDLQAATRRAKTNRDLKDIDRELRGLERTLDQALVTP